MFEYTKHALNKLRRKRIRELHIKKETVEAVIRKPTAVDSEKYPKIAVAPITNALSLCVVFREIEKGYRIITFFPAEKGRYEGKILQGR